MVAYLRNFDGGRIRAHKMKNQPFYNNYALHVYNPSTTVHYMVYIYIHVVLAVSGVYCKAEGNALPHVPPRRVVSTITSSAFFFYCTRMQASNAADLVLRRATRQAVVRARDLLRPPPPPFPFLPRLPALPLPIPDSVVDAMSPRLTPEEVRGSQRPCALTFFAARCDQQGQRTADLCVSVQYVCVPFPSLLFVALPALAAAFASPFWDFLVLFLSYPLCEHGPP